eukprot:TRINITY_DN764_c0_g1_i2.p1 TRINITY_DN764_c0_g1~~TRINITY_DN764_c0_g1_i2.p1  ORF type:complete len:127 (-),score=1.47 TRINITY_DN764_c0_g1_i2:19-399(-)
MGQEPEISIGSHKQRLETPEETDLHSSKRGRNQNDTITTHKKQLRIALRRLDKFLHRFFIDFRSCDCLFNIPKNQIQMLIVSVQAAAKFTTSTTFDKNNFVNTQTNQIKWLFDSLRCRNSLPCTLR